MQNFDTQRCCSALRVVKRLLGGHCVWCRNFDENVKKNQKMNFPFFVLKSFLIIILSWKKSWGKLKRCFARSQSDGVHKSVKSLKKLSNVRWDPKCMIFTTIHAFREPLRTLPVTTVMLSAMKIFWRLYFSIPRGCDLFDIMVSSF